MKTEKPMLLMEGINKSFSGVKVLKNVDFQLREGEVHCLLGENGAGKSTLIKILCGIYSKDSGAIYLNGEKASITSTSDAIELGISAIQQETSLVPSLRVVDNIFLGSEIVGSKSRVLLDESTMMHKASEVLGSIGVELDVRSYVKDLTAAQQQMVEIAKSLVYEHKIIIMDEPTSSLSAKDTKELFEIIRRLKKQGTSIIYISHRMEEIFEICDRITILRDGSYIATVNTADTDKKQLIDMMVGRTLDDYVRPEKTITDEVVLEVKNLSRGKKVKDVSFQLHKGEILGFAGLVNAGRTETMRCVFGIDKCDSGEITILGKKVNLKRHTPELAVKMGISYLSEDRKREGLVLKFPLSYNVTLAKMDAITTKGLLDFNKERTVSENAVSDLHIAASGIEQAAQNLSGGNQQKVVIGKWLLADSEILIFDEPTRGIDVGARAEIYAIINSLAQQGKSIIVVSSDLPEVMRISDRILVMCEGSLNGEIINNSEVTQNDILGYMLGGTDND